MSVGKLWDLMTQYGTEEEAGLRARNPKYTAVSLYKVVSVCSETL